MVILTLDLGYKRLEAGRFQWPSTENDVLSITHEQFQWLMQDLAIEQKKVIPKVAFCG
ncbi:IS66 family insertion sequence element accessory protein TnpB [Cellulosilyticum ruminicola]|uniref:IS66 family insertion sequence element accessory protein TnpB n=1 Tax=Cellulosilyticum ruminicola TaxID=425254 RepID=UPI0009FA4AEF